MSFVVSAFTLAAFCFVFGFLAAWAGYRSNGIARALLLVFSVSYVFLSLFSVLVGVGFSIELTNQAPCENLLNNTITNYHNSTHGSHSHANHTDTYYYYVDSCADRTTPESVERLYQAYAYILLAVLLVSAFAVMFVGLRSVLFKW